MNRHLRKLAVLLVVCFLAGGFLRAEDSLSMSEDAQVSKVAHEKSYPGGRDEEDLEVQAQLQTPVRKDGTAAKNMISPTNDDEF